MLIHQSAMELFEAFLDAKIPNDYRDYLLQKNGETPTANSFDIPGEGMSSIQYFFPLLSKTKTDALPYKLKLYSGRIPDETLPIGRDPAGNLILLGIKGKDRNKIFFGNHENEADDEPQPYYANMKILAQSFKVFLGNLK